MADFQIILVKVCLSKNLILNGKRWVKLDVAVKVEGRLLSPQIDVDESSEGD